ncbi:MAG TPA: glycosyltransferase [Anaerolineae bacterium]|nr:glycosyltransferase [Anaerolineae bacterium]
MRILHIYKDYFPVVGGIENHVRLLAEEQAARGHDVTVLVTSVNRHTRVETRNRVKVIYASRLFNVSSAPFSVDLFRYVSRIESDIIHLHEPFPFGEMANYFGGRSRAAVMTYHSDIVRQRFLGALYAPFLQRILARVNTIIATSPNYIESSPVLRQWKEKCVVVPLGIEIKPTQKYVEQQNQRNGQLLFVGKLRYYKGLNYLIDAMRLLPNAHLTVVGSGPMEREWRTLAEQLGVNERITWAGEVADESLGAYFAACDVFVLPCSERSEAFGTVQLEAMAAGKPMVSCDVKTGVAWVNQNEVTGLVVPPKDSRALAEAIARLINDDSLRARMGAAGVARVQAEFTLEKMVERVMKVYENALA